MTRGVLTREGANPKTLTMMAQMAIPNVEPGIYWESAHHSGCRHWIALVWHARRIPLLSSVNECTPRQRSFDMAGLLAKYRRYTNQNPIFMPTHIC
jgi:hypothetical protein